MELNGELQMIAQAADNAVYVFQKLEQGTLFLQQSEKCAQGHRYVYCDLNMM